MKFPFIATLILTSLLSINAKADIKLNKTGIFEDHYPIGTWGYQDAKSCEDDGGTYEDGRCIFQDGGTTIKITKKENGKFNLLINSIGTNLHTCDYEGEATDYNARQLFSKDSDKCEIIVNFFTDQKIAIITNRNCQEYCGAYISLDVKSATRAK